MIRVVLAEDHALVREALSRCLKHTKKIEVVAQAATGATAISLTKRHRPDVLVLDLTMPDGDGLEVLSQLVAFHVPTKILVLTMHEEASHGVRAIRAGAAGFLHKSASMDDLIAAIERVTRDDLVASKAIMDAAIRRSASHAAASLSPREFQIMGYLAAGQKGREIADILSISVKTVDTHRAHVLRKLSLRNNSDLTRFAVEHDLMPV